MDLRQIRYFVEIAGTGSFSRAAERLNVAQPALSQQIKNLEIELSIKLFERSSRGIKLTPTGEVFLAGAQRILGEVDNLVRQVGGKRKVRDVRLGVPTVLSRSLAGEVLHAESALAHTRLRVIEAMGDVLVEWLREGRLDAAVVFSNQQLEGLSLTRICSEETYLTGPAGHRLPDRDIEFETIGAYPLIMGEHKHGLHKMALAEAACRNIEVNIRLETDASSEIKNLVIASRGFTLLSPLGFGEEYLEGRLRVARLVRPQLRRDLLIAHRNNASQALLRAVEAVCSAVRQKSAALERALQQRTGGLYIST